MRSINFVEIVKEAWQDYAPNIEIVDIIDASARVSTNHVFEIILSENRRVYAKLSYFGKYEHFVEDHTIINQLAGSLPLPYQNLLSRSLMKRGKVYTYRYSDAMLDAWVVFYDPIMLANKLPRRQDDTQIKLLGSELAHFHKTCAELIEVLPTSSKTLQADVAHLEEIMASPIGNFEHRSRTDIVKQQCEIFLENAEKLGYQGFDKLPVFVDWNIGNFSVTETGKFFSRWDYDWFRMSSRVMDFYFFSRVVSDIGDKTVFSYVATTLMEERFILFLKEYHKVYPMSEQEVRFIGEAYRFFILNYVVKDGRYFFHEIYANKLLHEAYEIYLPNLDKVFDAEKLLKALGI